MRRRWRKNTAGR